MKIIELRKQLAELATDTSGTVDDVMDFDTTSEDIYWQMIDLCDDYGKSTVCNGFWDSFFRVEI